MVNRCRAVGCRGVDEDPEQKVSLWKFPYDRPELLPFWVSFVNRQNWSIDPVNKTDYLCSLHFETKYIRTDKQRRFLSWKLKPVPTIQSKSTERFYSCQPTLRVPRKDPRDRIFQKDQLADFKKENLIGNIVDFKDKHIPIGFTVCRNDESIVFHKMQFDDMGFPKVSMAVRVDSELHVKLQLNGNPVPLPEFFRKGSDCRLTCATVLDEIVNYLTNLSENDKFPFLDELNLRHNYSPKGRPPFSAGLMRYALLLYHTSRQAYRLLLEKFPLPSMSLLDRLQRGCIDSMSSASLLRENGKISEDIILLCDEMYLQKQAQYHGGKYVGEDEDGNKYKGIFVLMIVGLKDSLPYVVKSCPEVTINGDLVRREIWDTIGKLAESGFNVRAVVTDNHGSNVTAFKSLLNEYRSDLNELAIKHPLNKSQTYLFFDNVHLLKNIRNNLLSAKAFSFPEFSFEVCSKILKSEGGYLSWGQLHKIHELDLNLQGHLKKAPKLTYGALHPGNRKQDVNLALSVFHETTIAATRSYFPDKVAMANFLELFSVWWILVNSKHRYNSSNKLGNACVLGDGKTEFFRELADYLDMWGKGASNLCLSKQTCSALVKTLRAQAALIDELLNEDGYIFVMTGRLQSDPLERRFSQYRQMSGGRFLVSLCEVEHSEKILKCRSLIKAGIDIEDDIFVKQTPDLESLLTKVAEYEAKIVEAALNDDSEEVATYIAGYVGKKLVKKSCPDCDLKLKCTDPSFHKNHYFVCLSRNGLHVPSQSLTDFVISGFAILDVVEQVIMKHHGKVNAREAGFAVLMGYCQVVGISCENHIERNKEYAVKVIVNIFFNNKRKDSTDEVRKDEVVMYKTVKRNKEN